MAVTDVRQISSGLSGSATGKNPARISDSYKSRYLVTCDDPTDSPDRVLAFFRGHSSFNGVPLPWMGRIFRFGNGGSTSSVCNSVVANYIQNSGGKYHVDAGHEPVEGGDEEDNPPQEGEDEDGKLTDNPERWRDEISVGYTQISIPAESGIFRRFVGGAGDNLVLKPGQTRAVTNSAGVPFDPLPEYEVEIKIIRITRYAVRYDNFLFRNFQGAVNSDNVVINKPKYRFTENIPQYCGRLKLNNEFAIINAIKIWRQTTEIYVNPLGWRRQIVDRGLDRRAMHGDPDGAGGTLSTDDIGDRGDPYHRKIVDADSYPIVEPVLLDGKGQPLDPGLPPVFLEFSFYSERPFAGLVNAAW